MPLIEPAHIKARSVTDITQPHAFPERIGIDAQVLFFVYYTNFQFFSMLSMHVPPQHRDGHYSSYLEQLRLAELPPRNPGDQPRKVQLATSGHILGEFARAVEFADIEIQWRNDPNNPRANAFDPKLCKDARYMYAANLPTIRSQVETRVRSVRKLVDVLPKAGSETQDSDACIALWKDSLGDYADSMLISRLQAAGIYWVLSDDMDVATFDNVDLYTANQRVITAAIGCNKLVNPRQYGRQR